MRTSLSVVSAVAASFLVATFAFAGHEGDGWKVPRREAERRSPIAADGQAAAGGKAVYAKQCAQCHGAGGKGDGSKGRDLDPRPSDLTSAAVGRESDGALYWKISTGRRPMPAFEKLLSQRERWEVVAYLRSVAPPQRPAAP